MAFWGPPRPSPTAVIGYRDGDPGNCRVGNLCWTSHAAASYRSIAARGKRNVKLTAADAVVIRRRKAAGETSLALAAAYRVTYQQIDAIVRGDVWPEQS